MVALPPFRQAGPPAEGLHHMMAPSSQRRVAWCYRAAVMLVLSGAAPTVASNAQFIRVPIMQLTHHLA
jgi:hypothetical protein